MRITSASSPAAGISPRYRSRSARASGWNHSASHGVPATGSAASSRSSAPASAAATAGTSCRVALTRDSSTLKAEMSTPAAWQPKTVASTSVVPDPAKGSSTVWPTAKWRPRQASTSCGTNFPRYGWSLWTCFVRSCSGNSCSAHDSSRSISPAPRRAYSSACVATRRTLAERADGLGGRRRIDRLRCRPAGVAVGAVAERLPLRVTAPAQPDGLALGDLPAVAFRVDDDRRDPARHSTRPA